MPRKRLHFKLILTSYGISFLRFKSSVYFYIFDTKFNLCEDPA